MRYILFLVFVFIFSFHAVCETVKHRDISPDVKSFLDRSADFKVQIKNLPTNHPDFPVKEILNAIYFEKRDQFQKAIALIEGLREKVNYLGMNKKSGEDSRKLVVGTLGGFNTWRELAYIILGRSYYATHNFELAIRSFSGVPETSIYYPLASLSLFWSYAGNGDYDKAETVLKRITKFNGSLSKKQKVEYTLQQSYLELFNKRYNKSFEISGKLLSDKTLPAVFRPLVFKAYAEAGFYSWSQQFSSFSFKESQDILGRVLNASKSFSKKRCDSRCAFFIAEAWWNYASIHRVEDPNKYQAVVSSSLKKADSAIAPFIQSAAIKKSTMLSEEAFFLSVVLAWENKHYSEALSRSALLEKLFPVGHYLVDSYQLIGDHYFDKKNYSKAIYYYRKLVKSGDYEKSTYGTYKAAWTFYNKGQKWSGLRHLEQIVQGALKNTSKEDHYSIVKESKRDMLLFMAELMNNEAAKKELEFLGFHGNDKFAVFDQLALTYKKIGRFDQSSTLYRFLLDQYLAKKTNLARPYEWFLELLDNSLRLRDFSSISMLSRQYLKQVIDSKIKKGRKKFFATLSNVVLTLHREARKTSDKRIIASTNEIYLLLDSLKSEEFDTKVYYHGAQMFQQTSQYPLSVKWYRLAADSSGELTSDAALSALYIAKRLSTRAGLNKEYKQYRPLVLETSKWYIERSGGAEQPHLAQVLYLENLVELEKYELFVKNYIDLVTRFKETAQNLNKLKSIEAKLINSKKYELLYQLLTKMLVELDSSKFKKLDAHLKLVAQQIAFQKGFESQKMPASSRLWYFNSLKYASDREVGLRTWNNIFALYDINFDYELLDSDLKQYYEFINRLSFSQYREVEQDLILTSLKYVENFLYKKELFLDSALIGSSYLDFTKKYSDIERLYKSYLILLAFGHENRKLLLPQVVAALKNNKFSSQQKLTLARYWLYSGDLDRSLNQAASALNTKSGRDPSLLIMRDIYFLSDDSSMREKISHTIDQNNIRRSPIISAIWNDLNKDKFNFDDVKSISFSDLESDEKVPAEKLISLVSEVDARLTEKVAIAKKAIKDLSLKNRIGAVCSLSEARKHSLNQLELIQKNALNFYKKWDDFHNGVAVKVGLFKGLIKKEQSSCASRKEEYYRFSDLDSSGVDHPFSGRILATSDYKKFKEISLVKMSSLDRIWKLLDSSQLTAAGLVLDHETNTDSIIIGNALIRLRVGDYHNAITLLSSMKANSAKLYLGITLSALGKSDLAKKKLEAVDKKKLSPFQTKLLNNYL